jgi:thiol-disulfide isomerase/thioredoxin
VPYCSLSGRQLYDFALNDLNGQVWTFRQNHGKLTLLDFWGVWCGPCQQTIPVLQSLHNTWGEAGLKVVGIHYPRDGTADMTRRVIDTRNLRGITYTLLLGGDRPQGPCPVRSQFRVEGYPTLVLLRADGTIIWGPHSGALDQTELTALNQLITRELGQR